MLRKRLRAIEAIGQSVLGDPQSANACLTEVHSKITHRIEGLDSGMFFKYIRQTTEHEDIAGRWLKNGVN